MRLIDADALKKDIETEWLTPQTKMAFFKIVDNAPTVETDVEVVAKDAYKQGYTDGWKERFGEPNERPQGEWKEFKYGLYYCSRCFEQVDKDIERIESLVSKGERSNFCPNCGADMRGKEE